MGATVLNEKGEEVPIVMGSYGIGVERIITAAVEQHHDEDGIVWPKALAPFDVVVTITNMKQDELREVGEKLYNDLRSAGFEVLLDDRDERAGVKFKDADLIGIPFRVTVGKRVAEGQVELFDRSTRSSEHVTIENVVSQLKRLALSSS
jgi:prolyl-tRNA synthetase